MLREFASVSRLGQSMCPAGIHVCTGTDLSCTSVALRARAVGPITQPVEKLRGLYEAGMRCARMNFSHGTHEVRRWG